MKRLWKKPLALFMVAVLMLVSLPMAVAADTEGAKFLLGDVNGANGVVEAVEGQYFYVYVYADQVQGLQSGSLILEYDQNQFGFYTSKSEPAKAAGLRENPYADQMEIAAGLAAGYPDKKAGMGYVSFSFFMNNGAMSATDVSIPEKGVVPLYKFSFHVNDGTEPGDYTFRMVQTRVEVNEQLREPAGGSVTVRVSPESVSSNLYGGAFLKGVQNNADPRQYTDWRFQLNTITAPKVVDTVNFAVPEARPAAIGDNAFGSASAGTKMDFLKNIVFSVPMRNNDPESSKAEYPLTAFSGLPQLENIVMEFTEADFADYSQYFTDDGILYRWDEDSSGNRLDTCKIYYIPPARASRDIYLSEKVTGLFGGIYNYALRSLSKEQVESLVFHVFQHTSFDQANIFSQQATYKDENGMNVSAQLHYKVYTSASVVSELSYHYNNGGDLVIPLDFNTHTLAAGSSAGLTQKGDSVVLAESNLQSAAVQALKNGQTSLSYTIAVSDGQKYEITVHLTHDHVYDAGKITTEPTCVDAGVKTFTCTICGESYTEAVSALGHSSDKGVVTKAPTCTETGVRTYTCTRCHAVLRTEDVPATGHTPNEGTVLRSATCRSAGQKLYTCTVCGEKYEAEYTDSNAHIWTGSPLAWRCSVCGDYRVVWNKPSSSYVENIPGTEPPATLPPETTQPVTEPPASSETTQPTTAPTEPTASPDTTAPQTTAPQTTADDTTRPTLPTLPADPVVTTTQAPTVPVPPTSPTEPDEPEYLLGDVTGDGKVNSADARLALRAAVRLETLSETQRLAADADKNGKIQSSDARKILRVAVKLDTFA